MVTHFFPCDTEKEVDRKGPDRFLSEYLSNETKQSSEHAWRSSNAATIPPVSRFCPSVGLSREPCLVRPLSSSEQGLRDADRKQRSNDSHGDDPFDAPATQTPRCVEVFIQVLRDAPDGGRDGSGGEGPASSRTHERRSDAVPVGRPLLASDNLRLGRAAAPASGPGGVADLGAYARLLGTGGQA